MSDFHVQYVENDDTQPQDTIEETEGRPEWSVEGQLEPVENLSFGNSLMLLKDKLANEEDAEKINEMKLKIKDMLGFYDA
jgi:hypothetical protein